MKHRRSLLAVMLSLAAIAGTDRASAQCDTWRNLQALTATGYAGSPTHYAVDSVQEKLYVVEQCYCGWHGINMPTVYARTGSAWSAMSWFEEGIVDGMAVLDSGAGPMLHIWGSQNAWPPVDKFLRWDGASWQPATAPQPPQPTAAAALDQGSGPVIHVAANAGILRWDGTAWTNIGVTLPALAPALALIAHDDGSGPALYAAGKFTSIAGVPAAGIARWNGTSWSAVGAGLSTTSPLGVKVSVLRSFQHGAGKALYAGGFFTDAAGNAANGVARWDGANWTGLGVGLPADVRNVAGMEIFDGGTGEGPLLVVSGSAGPTLSPFLRRLGPGGWTSTPPATAGHYHAGGPIAVFDLPDSPGLDLLSMAYAPLDARPIALEACDLTGSLTCVGDGSGAACPCGNESAPAERAGCRHSLGYGGALRARGRASLSEDTLILEGSAMPSSSVLYFQGATSVPQHVFGDGLKCTGGPFVRLATRLNVNGASQLPGATEPHLAAWGHVAAPATRHYQARYRNSSAFCTSATFNYTNAVGIVWGP